MSQKDFPRGGKKPKFVPPSKSLLFEKNNPIKEKKARVKKGLKRKDHEEDVLIATTAQSLTYSNLCEGMVLLCRVHEVTDYDLIVSLPGRLGGRVKATDISESYTNLLQSIVNSKSDSLSEFKTLTELYSPGDNIIAYIKALDEDDRCRVTLSLESNLVNQNLSSDLLSKGSKIICTISSVEDHGYIVETGITNVRAFLAKNNIEEGSEYFPGKQITCAVRSIKREDNSSTVILSTKIKHLEKMMEDVKTLDSLLPGIQLTLTIKKILSNGLQVSFNDGKVGYINQVHVPKTLSNYTPGLEVDGTLLYIIPTVKFAYFTLLKQTPEKSRVNKGDILTARVQCRESNGILLKIGKNLRGFVPYRRTDVNFDRIHEVFVPESEHKCRILTYDYMDRVYICTMEKTILNEKYLSRPNIETGEIMDVTISEINEKTGFVIVSFGKSIGTVAPEHISDTVKDMKIGQVLKARVLSINEKGVKFTLKSVLINSKLPILDSIQRAKSGNVHHGIIRQITENGIMVKLFGDLAGWVPRNLLNPRFSNRNWNHYVGEVVTVEIICVKETENRLTLKIMNKIEKQIIFEVGEAVIGTVVDSSMNGIQLRIKKDELEAIGFLPAGHISPCLELGSLIAARTVSGDVLSAQVFSTFPSLLLTTSFAPQKKDTSLKNLKYGSTILISVHESVDDGLIVTLPIQGSNHLAFVKNSYLCNKDLIHTHQILLGKILHIKESQKEINLTTIQTDLWSKSVRMENSIMSAIDTLSLYLLKLKNLGEMAYYKNKPISLASIGQRVEGIVEKMTEHGLVLKLKNNLQATVRKDHYKGNLKIGDTVKGVVIWVNLIYELVEVTLLPQIMSHISVNQDKFENLPSDTKLRGTIVFITNWFILVLLKGQFHGKIVALPVRLHLNDLNPNLSTYFIGQKIRCFVVLNGVEFNTLSICLPKAVFDIKNTFRLKKVNNGYDSLIKNRNGKKKRKNETEEEEPTGKKSKRELKEKDSDEEIEVKEEESDEEIEVKEEEEDSKLCIPACGFYWDTTPNSILPIQESSSESEDESDDQPKQKKKKLSAAERQEQERQKEREIREREEALASSDHMPNSVDQFDRLVLGSPDSSLVWMQYMAYHLQATEVDKARAIASRAVKTINFREEDERLNVWQAWLNLESKFGTPESLDEVFQEAIKVNDAGKVYAHMLSIYSDAGKHIEMEKTVNMIVKKFKERPEMWIKCGEVLLAAGLKDKSRHIMQRAIQSLPALEHVNLMQRFALMENNYGDKERSQTLFEQILNTYPKRIDVWSSYVDSLVKSGNIEIARKVLERSVTTQVLPPKKMKVLFQKFINFEEKYGTLEAVKNVRELANEYVKEHSG